VYMNWKTGGIALGLVFFLTVAVSKPIGVSTEFVLFDGLLAKTVAPDIVVKDESAPSGYRSSNAYLNSSGGKMAKAIAEPLNYGIVFVLSLLLGGYLGKRMSGTSGTPLPEFHRHRFGNNTTLRYTLAFAGGVLVLWGARLAGGCTSGHMMSGMMQTAVSGYLFTLGAMIVAIPAAILFYKR